MDTSRGVPDGTENDTDPNNTARVQISRDTLAQEAAGVLMWKPNDSYLQSLISMGISAITAKKALYYTKNSSTEAAIEWIFENQDADLETPLEIELQQNNSQVSKEQSQASNSSGSSSNQIKDQQSITLRQDSPETEEDDLFKMVFVVNAELSMGVGKIGAQVAHAAIGLHNILLQNQSKFGVNLLQWTEYGETKIVLRGENTQHLVELERRAVDLGLPCYLVHDAGKTQVRAGSTTVFAVFGSNSRVDTVTGSLKLY